VFDTLIESGRRGGRKGPIEAGIVSLFGHGAIVAAAVFATMQVGQAATGVRVDTALVFVTQPQSQPKPPEAPPPGVPMFKGFQTVVAPVDIPTNIPAVNLQEKFDPRDYSGIGVEGGSGTGIVVPSGQVFTENLVEEKPTLLVANTPVYPELLRAAGIQGRVVIQAIVDTTGHVEPNSVRIVRSPNPEFNKSAHDWILKVVFRPARVRGQAVRVLVEVPIDYRISSV
jgi:periplasmic protein TonB